MPTKVHETSEVFYVGFCEFRVFLVETSSAFVAAGFGGEDVRSFVRSFVFYPHAQPNIPHHGQTLSSLLQQALLQEIHRRQ